MNAQEWIDRYVNAVGSALPVRERGDVEAEIRSLIQDELEARDVTNLEDADEATVLADIRKRDERDSSRSTSPLQQAEDRNLAGRAPAALALPVPAEIALVGLDLTAHEAGFRSRQLCENDFAQLVKEQDRGVAVYPGQFGGRPRRRARTEVL